jgi:GTPase
MSANEVTQNTSDENTSEELTPEVLESLPVSMGSVAIIGRPNVGKSTLFNVLTGTRKAVVKDQPGVTRDIQIGQAEWCGTYFDVLDTGGLTDSPDVFSKMIKEQVLELLKSVDLILFVVDARAGLCPEDRDIMRVVHRAERPYLVISNKTDSRGQDEESRNEFLELSETIIPTSFEQRRNLDDVLEWVVKNLPNRSLQHFKGLTLAVVGKPNAGKSSFCNKILGFDRMLVSEIPGTTVDAVDLDIEYKDKKYKLVDTAGLRRKAKRKEDVEIISAYKSEEALRRADIILLFVDGTLGPSDQDAKIVEMVIQAHKGVILVANKSDIGVNEIPEYRKGFREKVAKVFHFFDDIQMVFISAKTGAGIEELFETIDETWEKLNTRISTGDLNRFFMSTIRAAPSPVWGTQDVKFYYLTQTQQRPPSFIAFANHPDGVTPSYRRFLIKNLKEEFKLSGVPIRIFAMKRSK